MEELPDPRLLPRECALLASELFGREMIVHWAEELLAGHTEASDSDSPDIAWLRGKPGWPAYWSRVWGARALLHLGADRTEVVLSATGDEKWRVREMALKVIARHALDDPAGLVDPLVNDPVERVRVQAWRALGMAEHA